MEIQTRSFRSLSARDAEGELDSGTLGGGGGRGNDVVGLSRAHSRGPEALREWEMKDVKFNLSGARPPARSPIGIGFGAALFTLRARPACSGGQGALILDEAGRESVAADTWIAGIACLIFERREQGVGILPRMRWS